MIGLHDADATDYPNLALMKLSAHHKAAGDHVDWFAPLLGPYDQVYSSKVFTYTPDYPYLPELAEIGGTGYGGDAELPDAIEHIKPDYNLYKLDYSLGFLTRGCPRSCPWCFVPAKEGAIRAHADVEEFAAHREVILMDNNVLAHDHGLEQIEKIIKLGLRVDFNQGLDSRLIDDTVARLLGRVEWRNPLRLACDFIGQMRHVERAVALLRWHNISPARMFCYVLVKDVEDALERVRFLKGINVISYAQPYRSRDGSDPPTKFQRIFAQWVNSQKICYSICWEDYLDQRRQDPYIAEVT